MSASERPFSLLDRVQERAAIDRIVGDVAGGLSGVCVLSGDAGMGKTRLLEYALGEASQLTTRWIAGVETERELSYAALHRLVRPFLDRLEELAEPQRAALEASFGLRSDAPADRFLVGLAALSLLSLAAEGGGLLCFVDDAQWVDQESLDALSFVARRLAADGIGLLFAVRDLEAVGGAFHELPVITVSGLPEDASLELLSANTTKPIDIEISRRVVTATSGCPLALTELVRGLTQDQLLGGFLDTDPLPIGRQLQDHFLRQVRELGQDAQLFLLVASAESSGDPLLIRRAVTELGGSGTAEDQALTSGLVTMRPNVQFRHPLVRAAVYGDALPSRRRAVHATLAQLIDVADPDRRVRHLASAAIGPDEAIAFELEAAADRAMSRGGYAVAVSFLVEAASTSPDREARARRLTRAATAAFNAGFLSRAQALIEQARPDVTDPLLAIELDRLDGRLRIAADSKSAPRRLLSVARRLLSLEPSGAGPAFLEALEACTVTQYLAADVSPPDVARAALDALGSSGPEPALADLLLEGIALLFLSEFARAMPLLQQAATMLRERPIAHDDLVRWFHLGVLVAGEIFDERTYEAWVTRVERHARESGALVMLEVVLLGRARLEVRKGDLAAAELAFDEATEITRLVGGWPDIYRGLKADLFAWRGDEIQTREAAAALEQLGIAIDNALMLSIADMAIATIEISNGRYAHALAAVEPVVERQQVGLTWYALATAVEAATRTHQPDQAARYLQDLERRAVAAGTDWALGTLARCQALVADDADAEAQYLEAIRLLESTTIATELALARLTYGEWLRRQNRRIDARVSLRAAHDAFTAMGAAGFAARARDELVATGEKVAKRSPKPVTDLTPQEAVAARLAAAGLTNAEIATRMFISSNTVDYHLRKVYRKLGIDSRRSIREAISKVDVTGAN